MYNDIQSAIYDLMVKLFNPGNEYYFDTGTDYFIDFANGDNLIQVDLASLIATSLIAFIAIYIAFLFFKIIRWFLK